jgi:hypothetical protein
MANPLSIPTSAQGARRQEETARTVSKPFGDLFNFLTEDTETGASIKDALHDKIDKALTPAVEREREVRATLPTDLQHLAMGADGSAALLHMLTEFVPGAPIDAADLAGGAGLVLGAISKARDFKKVKTLVDASQKTTLLENGHLDDIVEYMRIIHGDDIDTGELYEAVGAVMENPEAIPLEEMIPKLSDAYANVRKNRGLAVDYEPGFQPVSIDEKFEATVPTNSATPEADILKASAADEAIADLGQMSTPEGFDQLNADIKLMEGDLADLRADPKTDANELTKRMYALERAKTERDLIARKLEKEGPPVSPVSLDQVTPQTIQDGTHLDLVGANDTLGTPSNAEKIISHDRYERAKSATAASRMFNATINASPKLQNPLVKGAIFETLERGEKGLSITNKTAAARGSVRDLLASQPTKVNEKVVRQVVERQKVGTRAAIRGEAVPRSIKDFKWSLNKILQPVQGEAVLRHMIINKQITRPQGKAIANWIWGKRKTKPSDYRVLTKKTQGEPGISEDHLKDILQTVEHLATEEYLPLDKKARSAWIKSRNKK